MQLSSSSTHSVSGRRARTPLQQPLVETPRHPKRFLERCSRVGERLEARLPAVGYGRPDPTVAQPAKKQESKGGGLPAWAPPTPANSGGALPSWSHPNKPPSNNVLSWAPANGAAAAAEPAASADGSIDEPQLGWKRNFEELYELKKAIGHGSFGEVRLAINKQSGEEVAVKTMQKVRGKLSVADTLQKVAKETDMLKHVQGCPGVVKLIGCFEDDKVVRLVTEVCRGGDLKKYVEGCGPLEEPALAVVAFEILKFVKACHDLNILYADIKPANFCLVESRPFESLDEEEASLHRHASTSHLKAIDFGSAHLLRGGERMDKRHGTLVYMAPEVFARDYSFKADVWSVGITLHWLFCQGLPYWPDGPEPPLCRMEDMQAYANLLKVRYDYEPWTEMSEEGKDFITKCLTQDQAARPSAAELLQHPWILRVSQDDQCGGTQCEIPIAKDSCPLPKHERGI